MTTYSSDAIVARCCYRQAGVYCFEGTLHRYRRVSAEEIIELDSDGVVSEPELLEGMPIKCPMCEGKGQLLTSRGRELLIFMDVFARPLLRDLVDELFEERNHH
jgi:hypothetical protein